MTKTEDLSGNGRQKLIQVARTLFAQRGFDAVSVREIARESGMNLSLVSYHFGGKEGLYKTIIEEHVTGVERNLRTIIESHKNLPEGKVSFTKVIDSILRMFFDSRENNPEISNIMQRERFSGLPFAREVHERVFAPIAIAFDDLVKEAHRQKILHPDVRSTTFFVCMLESLLGYFSFMECQLNFTQSKNAHSFPVEKEKFIQFLVRLYSEGIYK